MSSQRIFNRPPRIRPAVEPLKVELPAAPGEPVERRSGWQFLLPLISAAVMIAAMFLARGGRSSALLFALPMAVMAVMGLTTSWVNHRQERKRQQTEYQRQLDFFEQRLAEQEARIQQHYDAEQAALAYLHPDPATLLQIAGLQGNAAGLQTRLWERRLSDDDFLQVRLGRGNLPSSLNIRLPALTGQVSVDQRLHSLATRYGLLRDVPVSLALAELGSVGLSGPREQTVPFLHSLLWQISTLHAPNNLRIAAATQGGPGAAAAAGEWDWLRWLPHTAPFDNDLNLSRRMCASSAEAIDELMTTLLEQLSRRRDSLGAPARPLGLGEQRTHEKPDIMHILVVVDGIEQVRNHPVITEIMRHGPAYGMAVIFLVDRWEAVPGDCMSMVDLADGAARWALAGRQWNTQPVAVDACKRSLSDALARHLANIKLAESNGNQDIPRNVRLFDLLGIRNKQDLLPPRFWSEPLPKAWHPDVPIGSKAGGELLIDLDENVHGSHGIIAGATGAGKSVLLQCIIAALVIKHSPVRLELLLIDFKGGAALSMFAPLPHTVGFVTDLEGRLADRAMTAIKSEIRRRKTILRDADAENIREYRAKAARAGLPPLPNLLIIVDEFDEMVTSYPDFVTEMVRVVKQGRSLGVHLLIATQQPSKAVKEDIRTQLKYFIALRLGSSEDSREMLLKPDAAFLPTNIPGRAYFRVGAAAELFQVAQITSEHLNADEREEQPKVILLEQQRGPAAAPKPIRLAAPTEKKLTDLDVMVAALAEIGPEVLAAERQASGWEPHPIWQPPLPARLRLAELAAPDLAATPRAWERPPEKQIWLQPAIGRLDIPQESRQDILRLDLTAGHAAIIGAPGSGKTMALRTIMASLALTHSPRDLWFYAIDAGGQGLSSFAQLPHLASLLQVRQREFIRRLIYKIEREVLRRQRLFLDQGAGDLGDYRHGTGQRMPAWVVLIDKLAMLREEFSEGYGSESIVEDLIRLARMSRPYGIYFIITADRASDFGHKLLALLENRITLRMPDLHDYSDILGERVASQIPATAPGRGLILHQDLGVLDLQLALPSLELPDPAMPEDDDQASLLNSELNAEIKQFAARLRQLWLAGGAAAADQPEPVRLLPNHLPIQELLAGPAGGALAARPGELAVPLGMEATDLALKHWRFSRDMPHMLLLGTRRSGKTATLRTLIYGLVRQYQPDELRLLIVDVRQRGLDVFKDLPHVEEYVTSEAALVAWTERLATLTKPAEQRWVIVIDDFNIGRDTMKDQFTAAYGNKQNFFSVLGTLATNGGESGIHLVVAANLTIFDQGVLRILSDARNGIVMWPNRWDTGTKLLGVSLPLNKQERDQPVGRAVVVQDDDPVVVQVAHVAEPALAGLAEEYASPAVD